MQKSIQKVVSVLLCAVLLCAAVPMCVSALETDQVYLGDVDGNDKVNAVDARFVLQKASGARELSELGAKTGDVNRDGKVNAIDARWILQYATGSRLLMVLDTQTDAVSLEATLNADSSDAEIVDYFNLVLNRVKPHAGSVTISRAATSLAGEIEGDMPEQTRDMLTKMFAENCGEEDVSEVPPAKTAAEKNELFPVEGESWSSKVTLDDVKTVQFAEKNGIYTISITVLADPLSADTQPGSGHFGKVFSVMTPADLDDGSGMMQNIKTGNRGGTVTITVDKNTGNVSHASYSGVYLSYMEISGTAMTVPLCMEAEYIIAW